MVRINKISSSASQAIQHNMNVRTTTNSVGAIMASNPGTPTGSMTDTPFPTVYFFEGGTGYLCGAEERRKQLHGRTFHERKFHIDPSIVYKSDISFQSERMQNVNQYEMNYVASHHDNSSIEGDA